MIGLTRMAERWKPRKHLTRIRRRSLTVPQAILWGLITLVFASQLQGDPSAGGRIFTLVLFFAGCFITFRVARMATINLDMDSVVIRRFLRTLRFNLKDIREFSTESRTSGAGVRGRALVVVLTFGRQARIGEFFSSDNVKASSPNSVDAIAARLNQALTEAAVLAESTCS